MEIRNRVKCLVCGEVLESKYRHDFQMCSCENQTFTDGGTDYFRRGGMDMMKVLSIPDNWTDEEAKNRSL